MNREPLSVDADLCAKKSLCQPGVGQDVIGHGGYDEPAFACWQGRKRDNLICSKPVQRRAGLKIVEQLFGDVLADRLRPASQGSRLVRTKSYRFSFIGKERQRHRVAVILCRDESQYPPDNRIRRAQLVPTLPCGGSPAVLRDGRRGRSPIF